MKDQLRQRTHVRPTPLEGNQLLPDDPEPRSSLEPLGFVPLSQEHASHSVWGNMAKAEDGRFYVAAGNHEVEGGDSWLFRLPGSYGPPEQCVSVRDILGTRSAQSRIGEAKIHTRLQQTSDGWIYMGTMQAGYGHLTKWSHYDHPEQYEGGHLLRYHPKNGVAEDLGIPVIREGLQTMVLDDERQLLYFVTWPKKQFIRYDLNTRTTTNFGVIAWSPTDSRGTKQHYARDLLIDLHGTVYCTNNFGALVYLRPGDGKLTETEIILREGDSLRTHVRLRDGSFYIGTSQGHIVRFLPEAATAEYVGPTIPGRPTYTPNLAITADERRLVYLAGSHGSYAPGGMQLVEYDLSTGTHSIRGYVHPRLQPSYCYASGVSQKGDYVFVVHGGEPSNSYVVRFDPTSPARPPWLLAEGVEPAEQFVFGPGSEGNVRGWIVARVHRLSQSANSPIPHDECGITALTASRSGERVFGATTAGTGGSAHLFVSNKGQDHVEGVVRAVDQLGVAQTVCALTQGEDEAVYGGTINLLEDRRTEPRSSSYPWPVTPAGYPGGHVFKWIPETGHVESLGIPIAGEGIFSICANPTGKQFFGLTFPHAFLISWSVLDPTLRTVAQIYDAYTPALRPDEFALATIEYMSNRVYDARIERLCEHRGVTPSDLPRDVLLKRFHLSRTIVCDTAGRVYGSAGECQLFSYDPADRCLDHTFARLPATVGTEYGLVAEPSLSAAVLGPDGLIYGGTTQDGYLFSLNPETREVRNLGKPARQSHIRGLAFRGDRLYGLVGEDLGKVHLFCYDLTTGSLDDLGLLQGNGRRGFAVNVADAIAATSDRLFIGQNERISALLSIDEIEYEPYQSP